MAYNTTAGATANTSKGGEYDNTDETSSASYENLAATQADAAATSATAAASSATSAAGSASTATSAATTATTQAGIATTQATNAATSASGASASASTATTQAGVATAQAVIATTQATNAATSASTATTQAGIATTSATNAASSASSATASATTATNSATTATTQASNAANSASTATAQATSATNSATTATTQAGIATTQATNAATSASTATTQASNASASASTATTQAGIATTQATNASTSATTATTQAGIATTQAANALTSANNAAASYDSFDDRYLGAKTSDPTVDNDGNALITGAMYFNSTSSIMKVYTGSAWMNTPGFATGGSAGQVLAKLSSTNYDTQWVSLTGGLIYGGTWNASTNTPTLASGVGTQGTYYVVSVSGSTNLDGVTDWVIGDWAIFNGTAWQKIDQTNLVTSVAGRTGAIVLDNTDISGLGTMSVQNANNVNITGGSITGASGIITAVTGTAPVSSSGGATPAISLAASYGDTQNPYASKTANFVLAAPNGSAGVPTFRAIVASDIPTLNQNTTGNAATATNVAYSGLTGIVPTWNQNTTGTAAGLSSTLAIGSGGTGQTTANTAFNALAPSQTSNANKYLKTDGTDTSWATVDALPSQTSQSGKYLTTNGTVASWATISLPTHTYTRTTFTATAGQTSFTVNYTSALLQVYLNGVLLDSTDYTASSGTAFVLTSAAALNDIVEAVVFNVINVGQVAANGVLGGTNGYVLTSDGTAGTWAAAPVSLPSQTGNANKFLKTDGTTASWNILPSVLNILNNASSVVAVSVANGFLPVLNFSGTTINVTVS
jgi:hypothetical protein